MGSAEVLELIRLAAGREVVSMVERGPGKDAGESERNAKALLACSRAVRGVEDAEWAQARADCMRGKAIQSGREMEAACRLADGTLAPANDCDPEHEKEAGMNERGHPTTPEELEQLRRELRARAERARGAVEQKSVGRPGDDGRGVGAGDDVAEPGARRPAGA